MQIANMKFLYMATVLASAALAVPQGVQRTREEHVRHQGDDIKKALRRQETAQVSALSCNWTMPEPQLTDIPCVV